MIDEKLARLRKLLREVDKLRDDIWDEMNKSKPCHQHQWRRTGPHSYECNGCGEAGSL